MKNNDRLRKLRRNNDFHVASFQRKNDHFDFAFSPFWCTRNLNWWLSRVKGELHPISEIRIFCTLSQNYQHLFWKKKTIIFASYTVANCPRNSKMKWNFKQAKQFFKRMSEDAAGVVSMYKSRNASWRANADFRVHKDPRDHLSDNHLFKSNSFSVIVLFNWL